MPTVKFLKIQKTSDRLISEENLFYYQKSARLTDNYYPLVLVSRFTLLTCRLLINPKRKKDTGPTDF
jgi:hypothetical protein